MLLAAVENQNQAVHVQRDVTLNHSRTRVETAGAVETKIGQKTRQFDNAVNNAGQKCVKTFVFKLLPEVDFS